MLHNMETETVFNFAKDGNLPELKYIFLNKPKNEVKILVTSFTNGCTPLLMACENGHLDTVVYLIKECHANIDRSGYLDVGYQKHEVTPLWCAAFEGNLKLVKTLINLKASVNKASRYFSTPLYAACFRGSFDIAQYLILQGADIEVSQEDGQTCLMHTCFKEHNHIALLLLSCGADIHRKDVDGKTALHYCAEAGNLEMLKDILSYGAQLDCNAKGFSPIVAAAWAGHMDIVCYFMHNCEVTRSEVVDAAELLGAYLLLKTDKMLMVYSIWKSAMETRFEDKECIINKPHTPSSLSLYINGDTEVHTTSELDELHLSPDRMRKQALLIIERFFGLQSAESVWAIIAYGDSLIENDNYQGCILFWMFALDIIINIEQLHANCSFSDLLYHFVRLFSFIMTNAQFIHRGSPTISFDYIMYLIYQTEQIIHKSIKQTETLQFERYYHRTLLLVVHLIGLACILKPSLSGSEEKELKSSVYRLVHMNLSLKNGWTLLHIACSNKASSGIKNLAFKLPCLQIVNLLLEVDASPNAFDSDRNTPLHVAALNRPFNHHIFMTLLKHGSHLDSCNRRRETPLQLCEQTLFNLNPLNYINLQCLSAQAVRTYKIPYKGLVGEVLKNFLDVH